MRKLLAALWLPAACAASPPGYLTARELERVRTWMPIYREAAHRVGVPPLALPAMHYRESDLRETWKVLPEERWIDLHRRHIPYRNMGGPFMMDRGGDGDRDAFDDRIREFERYVAARFGVDPAPRVRDDFPFACLCAAVELKDKARGRMFDAIGRVDRDVLADALWGYNGRRRGQPSWKGCAYVCSDPRRGRRLAVRMCERGCATEYADARPGTMVIYAELERRL